MVVITVLILAWFFWPKNTSFLQSPQTKLAEDITPSKTLISCEDPSGFKFDYPDNLSISIEELSDPSTYSSLQVYSKKTDGSISLTVSDTKLKNTEDWIKENNFSTAKIKDTKIANLEAKEITSSDRVYLIAIDNGVQFVFEMPTINQKFWTPTFEKIVSNFSFGSTDTQASQASTQTTAQAQEEVFFEGEETVE